MGKNKKRNQERALTKKKLKAAVAESPIMGGVKKIIPQGFWCPKCKSVGWHKPDCHLSITKELTGKEKF